MAWIPRDMNAPLPPFFAQLLLEQLESPTSPIRVFHGPYRWLSNFWPAEVALEGLIYPTVEQAYQAAKTWDDDARRRIQSCPSASQAKALGRRLTLRPDWDQVKLPVMRALLTQKFQDPELCARLLATGDRPLIEGNWWRDTFWGVWYRPDAPEGVGANHLGQLLMQLRTTLRATPT